MRKLKEWFYGEVEIPSRVLYVAIVTGVFIYVASIITSIIINN